MDKNNTGVIVGRRSEKELLGKILYSNEAEFVAVYGRRRVGKTFLVRKFFENEDVFFEVTGIKDGLIKDQLLHFYESLERIFSPFPQAPVSWPEAFDYLKKAIQKIAKSRKIILFFDELPWLATRKSGFLSALDHFWNHWASQQKQIKLIVCGSAASWMIDKVVNAKGGLHNRLTHTIRLLPFDLSETKAFLWKRGIRMDDHQISMLYLVMGGVPHYLKQVEKGLSAIQNINKICFTKDGLLVGEFNKLYASLFDNAEVYIKVVRTLAKTRHGMTRDELLQATGLVSGGGAAEILRNLEEAGFIAGYTPYGRRKHGKLFRIVDEYSYFYIKWIETAPPSVFEEKQSNYWILKQASHGWEAWAGFAFEDLCLKHVEKIKSGLGIAGVMTQHGPWRYMANGKNEKEIQIDLLLDRMDRVISICEIKYHRGIFVITKAYAEELRRKIAVFKEQTKTRKAIFLVMITCHGMKKNSYYHELVQNELILKDFL